MRIKHLLRITSFILIFTLVVSISVLPNKASDYTDALSVIKQYAPDDGTIFSIKSATLLKSLSSEKDTYTLYELEPYGYAVLLNETNSLMEADYSSSVSTPIDSHSTTDYFYGGPMCFIEKLGSSFVNMASHIIISDSYISELSQIESGIIAHEKVSQTSSSSSIYSTTSNREATSYSFYAGNSYFRNLVNFGNNSQGTCTVIAACILLGYYDNHLSERYVPTSYEQGNGTSEAFHLHLQEFVYGEVLGEDEQGGVFIMEARKKINNYLDSVNVSARLVATKYSSSCEALWTNMIYELQTGYPVMAAMFTAQGSPLGDHTVVVYGVDYSGTSYANAIFTCHLGWQSGSTAYKANAGWFREYGKISCGLPEHTEIVKSTEYNATKHMNHCICGGIVYEAHTAYVNHQTGICRKCGYNGPIAVAGVEHETY